MSIGKVERVSPVTSSNAVSAIHNTSKNLQNQIQTKEQNLNRLSTDSKLSREEKEKKRQELQKEIEELNRKLELMRLKQEEAEKKEKTEQEKETARKEEIEGETTTDKFSLESLSPLEVTKSENEEETQKDMSVQDAQNMLHQNFNLRNDLIENSTDFDKQNTIRILKTEIQQDELRGQDTDSKKEDLQELREKENFWIEARNEAYQKQREHSVALDIQLSIGQ